MKIKFPILLPFALGLVLMGNAQAACDVTVSSVPANGQVVLKANCGAVALTSINWKRGADSISGEITLTPNVNNTDIYYTTQLIGGTHSYTATGNAGAVAAGTPATVTSPNPSLTVAPTVGGTIASTPPGITGCTSSGGTCTGSFDTGTTVSLAATPATGYVFANWAGDCAGTASVCALAMNGPRVVTANFGPVPTNGACGSDSNSTPVQDPPGDPGLCSGGTPTAVNNPAAAPWNYTWGCNGLNGGTNTASTACSAPKQISGFCGTLSGGAAQSTTPSDPAQLCSSGTPSSVSSRSTPSYQYYWTCNGINSGANSAECAVAQLAANGVCGTANNQNVPSTPTGAAACTTGTVTGMSTPSAGGDYTWTCAGTGGGTSSGACIAHQTVNGACGTANGQSFTSLTSGSANLCVAGTAVASFAGSGPWTWGCNGANGGTSTTGTACSASLQLAASDPGRGTRTWMPTGATNIWVLDQMGTPDGAGTVNYVPGCLNNAAAPSSSSSGCALSSILSTSFNGVAQSVTLALNNIVSVRYRSTASAPTFKAMKLSSSSGGNIGFSMSLWISSTPPGTQGGGYDDVATGCKATSTGTPTIYTAASYCEIAPNTNYYVNIRSNVACSGATCRFQLGEGATSDLY